MTQKLKIWILFIIIALLFIVISLLSTGFAQEFISEKTFTSDEQRMIQRIKEEVVKELKEEGFLREQIELGIQDYIKKQQQVQSAANAEKERMANEKAKKVRRVSSTRDHIYGDPNAPISLIEYSDSECPFCKRFHQTAKQIVDAYQGKVNWVYRHFPLSMHNPVAQKQAEAAECANELGGNDGFWKYNDTIYARTRSNGNGFPITALVPLATELGFDTERFRQCLESGRQANRVKEDINEGIQIGVTGTPATFLLNNKTGDVRVKTGQKLEAFKADIEKMLE